MLCKLGRVLNREFRSICAPGKFLSPLTQGNKLMSDVRLSSIAVLVLVSLAACADPVQLKPGAEAVHVSSLGNVGGCVAHGFVHVGVMNKMGPINRNELTVEDELADLARNAALGSGGDTVAAAGPVVDGAQDFNVYVCRK